MKWTLVQILVPLGPRRKRISADLSVTQNSRTADLTRPRVSREHGSFRVRRNNGLRRRSSRRWTACCSRTRFAPQLLDWRARSRMNTPRRHHGEQHLPGVYAHGTARPSSRKHFCAQQRPTRRGLRAMGSRDPRGPHRHGGRIRRGRGVSSIAARQLCQSYIHCRGRRPGSGPSLSND